MYKASIDKYAFPNKWIEEDFEKLAALWERCEKKRTKKAAEPCPQFEPKKGR